MNIECIECDRKATHTGPNGEPLCREHWIETGSYDPDQGYEPTESDYMQYCNH